MPNSTANPTVRKFKIYQRRYLKFDITAGLVVFLVAIPLCLGIALASGAPLFSGIISGIIGGIVVGSISQSSISISGPGNGLIAIVLAAIAGLGGFDTFLLALVFAGLLQIIIGTFRAGFIADYIPNNVIQGLLCAIGILIIVKQLPLAFTHAIHNETLMDALKETTEAFSLKPLLEMEQHINLAATIITLLSILILIYFDKTKVERLKTIPGPVIVVIVGVILNEIFEHISPGLAQFSPQLVNIPVNHNFSGFLSQFQFPNWHSWTHLNVYITGISVAAIASLETLLNLEAAEKLDTKKRYSSRNRELIAQGIGNTIAGLIGGLPISSVVARTSVNVEAGAKTKFAGIIHGLLILIAVMLIPRWLNTIPLASLAAILIFVGYKLTKPAIYKRMYTLGFAQFFPFIVTVAAIVIFNLLLGVLIGLCVSFFFILKNNSEIRLNIINEKHPFGIVKRIILPQQVSFLRKAALMAELAAIPEGTQLIIDARYSKYIDREILELLNDFMNRQAIDKKIALNLIGFKEKYQIHDHIDFINVTTHDVQSALMPTDVLEILKEGNFRFLNDHRIHRSLLDDLKQTANTQHPIAVVLACIDSRLPIEAIFDMGVGDVFVIRVAGNVVNDDILASIEFACSMAGAKLIVVLGHTGCGAIKAACDNVEAGYLVTLLSKIKPAIAAETETVENRTGSNDQFTLNVTKINVANITHKIYLKSNILKKSLDKNEIGLIGAIYDIKNGTVTFDPNFFSPEHSQARHFDHSTEIIKTVSDSSSDDPSTGNLKLQPE